MAICTEGRSHRIAVDRRGPVRADSRGNWFDARYLTALEHWTGDDFVQLWSNSHNPYPQASAALMRQYGICLQPQLSSFRKSPLARLTARTCLCDGCLPHIGQHIFCGEFRRPRGSAIADGQLPSDCLWHGIVRIAESLADDAGADLETLASAMDAALITINPQLSFNMLQRTILGGNGNDRLIGTSTELDEDFANPDPLNWTLPDLGGIDWIVGGPGNDKMSGGYGRDTYVFGTGFGQDVVTDNFSGQYTGSGDQDDVVQLIGGLTLASIEQSILTIGGNSFARIAIVGTDDRIDFELNKDVDTGLPRRRKSDRRKRWSHRGFRYEHRTTGSGQHSRDTARYCLRATGGHLRADREGVRRHEFWFDSRLLFIDAGRCGGAYLEWSSSHPAGY